MTHYNVMTPGPTNINSRTLEAMSTNMTNPDLDPQFFEFYRDVTQKYNDFIGNDGETYILCGEGILGLEAACASFIENGSKVISISNGIFGKGFADFASMYGGDVTLYESDRLSGIDSNDLAKFIDENGPFDIATVVHCETPSGITNDVAQIGKVLSDRGILSIVDSVSAIGGEEMKAAHWNLDVVLCASQKAFSAPVGLTLVSLSNNAIKTLDNRKTQISGFYSNLKIWKDWYDNKWFPYTQPAHLITAFSTSLDSTVESGSLKKHKEYAAAIRKAFIDCGYSLYANNSFSNTVTTVDLPEGIYFKTLFDACKAQGVLIGGGFDFLENKVFRIGHMGDNCDQTLVVSSLEAIDKAFAELIPGRFGSLAESFKI